MILAVPRRWYIPETGIYHHSKIARRRARLGNSRTAALSHLHQVPEDLGVVYQLVYTFIRKGGKLPVYARWIEGEEART